jgi:Na+/H+ antiporter NhaD/arsenite permease-like protein
MQLSAAPPAWTVVPFAAFLLLIAVLPLSAPHFWEQNRNKLLVALAVSVPAIAYLSSMHPAGGHLLVEGAREYAAFMALLGALFVISGGIFVGGSIPGTPLVNTGVLALGALLANFIGTTGASVLLIRPLLRANAARVRTTHVVVFFIFIVSNGAGLLTPLGDPPLFLGFLRGVPFTWTLRLAGVWAVVVGALLLVFNLLDQAILNREERERPGSQLEEVQRCPVPLSIEGAVNLGWLAGVVVVVFLSGAWLPRLGLGEGTRAALQIGSLVALTLLSLATTPRRVHEANQFGWGPIVEVAVLFFGIFATMIPALHVLAALGPSLGVTEPWQFFWATGLLSSFLDNAPTYLTFASLASGVVNAQAGGAIPPGELGALAAHPTGAALLAAISCGAVFMGAVTYIGNGPNFMVKAIAEQHRVRMPSFFGYVLWSGAVLMPIFVVVTLIFFV